MDDADLKARKSPSTDDTWQSYSSTHSVTFLETRPLLESGMVVRASQSQSVYAPAGEMFVYTAKFAWSKAEDYFVIFDIDNGNKVAKFSTRGSSTGQTIPLESCIGNALCACPFGAPTESSEYRYPDGLSASDLVTVQSSSSFNCGK